MKNSNLLKRVKKSQRQVMKEYKIILLKEFYEKFGRAPTKSEEYKGEKLGLFWKNIRTMKTKIDEQDKRILEETGYVFLSNRSINKAKKIALLVEFYKEHGRAPKHIEEYKGEKLGNFLHSIKAMYTQINEQDKKILEETGYVLTPKHCTNKAQKIALLVEFYKEYGRAPTKSEEYKGEKLGNFLHSIKTMNTQINEQDKKLLEETGYVLTLKSRTNKAKKIALLVEFYKEHGRAPKYNEEYKGEKLGQFLNSIRSMGTKIDKQDKKMLEEMGYVLTAKHRSRTSKAKKIALLVEFYKEYGRAPKRSEEYKGERLGHFLHSIKTMNTQINEQDRKLLEETGYVLTLKRRTNKAKKIALLVEFYKEHGRAPKHIEEYKGEKLGQFLNSIRSMGTKIDEQDKRLLEETGYVLTPKHRTKKEQ